MGYCYLFVLTVLLLQGPGMIIDNELKNVMRSHHDLEKDNTPYMKKAMRVCDLFVFT